MSLGSILSTARNSAGLTIETLAQRTNIRAAMLREFEADNFLSAGGDTYAKGHLRSLAFHLKLDSNELIAAYDAEQGRATKPIYERLVEYNAAEPKPERRSVNSRQLVVISILAILVLIGGSVVVTNLKSSNEAPQKELVTQTPTPSATPTAKTKPSVTPTPYATVSSGEGVTVVVKAVSGVSWINITDASGTTLFSGRMSIGDVRTFTTDKEINARFGNAGALQLTVNGKKQAPLGGEGEVVTVTYGVNS